MVEVGDGVAVVVGYNCFDGAVAPGVIVVGGDHASRDIAVQANDVSLRVIHEVVASRLAVFTYRQTIHRAIDVQQRLEINSVAPAEAQQHPIDIIILRGDGSCNRIEGLFRPGAVDVIFIARRHRALAVRRQLTAVLPSEVHPIPVLQRIPDGIVGNACERRRWRIQLAGVGAAVDDWLGGLSAADRAGHRKGQVHHILVLQRVPDGIVGDALLV